MKKFFYSFKFFLTLSLLVDVLKFLGEGGDLMRIYPVNVLFPVSSVLFYKLSY
jgi:hypothetical protein